MGGAILMLQDHLTEKKIVRQINLLFEDPEEMERMSEKIHSLARDDAAKKVTNEIIKLGKEFIRSEEVEE